MIKNPNLDQFPTLPEEFLIFKDIDIYGFTLHSYPDIDGLVALEREWVSILISKFSYKLLSYFSKPENSIT